MNVNNDFSKWSLLTLASVFILVIVSLEKSTIYLFTLFFIYFVRNNRENPKIFTSALNLFSLYILLFTLVEIFYVKNNPENNYFYTPDTIGFYVPQILIYDGFSFSEYFKFSRFFSITGFGFSCFHYLVSKAHIFLFGFNSVQFHKAVVTCVSLLSIIQVKRMFSSESPSHTHLAIVFFGLSWNLVYAFTLLRDVHTTFLILFLFANLKKREWKTNLWMDSLLIALITLFRPTHGALVLMIVVILSKNWKIFIMPAIFFLGSLYSVVHDLAIRYSNFHLNLASKSGGVVSDVINASSVLQYVIFPIQMNFNPFVLTRFYQVEFGTNTGEIQVLSAVRFISYALHFVVIFLILFAEKAERKFGKLELVCCLIFVILPAVGSHDIRRFYWAVPLLYLVLIRRELFTVNAKMLSSFVFFIFLSICFEVVF